MYGLTLTLAAAIAVLCLQAQAAVYTDTASFQTATGGTATVSSPLYSVVYTDAYGSFSPPSSRGPSFFLAPIAGMISGQFGCFGNENPCRGAYRETITLPYQIMAISGQLSYYDQGIGGSGANILDLPLSAFFSPYLNPTNTPYSYKGFYAQTFAPTSTLTFAWVPGLFSYDEIANFTLAGASVIVATPEPATLALLLVPILGIVAFKRQKVSI